jgi:hypothetical protein
LYSDDRALIVASANQSKKIITGEIQAEDAINFIDKNHQSRLIRQRLSHLSQQQLMDKLTKTLNWGKMVAFSPPSSAN